MVLAGVKDVIVRAGVRDSIVVSRIIPKAARSIIASDVDVVKTPVPVSSRRIVKMASVVSGIAT